MPSCICPRRLVGLPRLFSRCFFLGRCSSLFYSFLVRLRIVRTNLVSKERPKEGWTALRITTIFPRVPFVKTLYAERKVKMGGHRLFLCNAFSARNVHTNRKR